MDLPEAEENFERLKKHVESKGYAIAKVSAATGEGLRELMYKAFELIKEYVPEEDEEELERFDDIDPDSIWKYALISESKTAESVTAVLKQWSCLICLGNSTDTARFLTWKNIMPTDENT